MIRRLSSPRMLIAAGLVATAGFATLRGQPERAPAEDMKALVAEVRALRLAVERTSAHTGQAQLLLGRVQLQENRLATLGRQLLEARTRLLDAQAAQAESEQKLRQISDGSRSGEDPIERQAMDAMLVELKHEVARRQARTTQLQGDETAAQHALTTEQQRWADFNDRLEALERTLGATTAPPR
jgi:hypothetical protein